MHAKENSAMNSSGDEAVKEDTIELLASTSSSSTSQTSTASTSTISSSTTDNSPTASLTDRSNTDAVSSVANSDNAVTATGSIKPVNGFDAAESNVNTEDSAVETDESSQDMVIAAGDIKQEVDSDCEDTVDGNVLHRLSEIDLKIEPDTNSNSSCSLNSFSNSFWNKESDASMRQRLFTSLSQSFPGSALSRMLHSVDTMPLDSDDEDLVPTDRLSSSCFGAIRLDKEDEDDELTSLAWLQDSDLLKNINAGEDDFDKTNGEQKENAEGQKNDGGGGGCVPQTHPSHVPYNPHKHVNSKPPYSFSCLIFMAVEDSPEKKLPVKDIYNWILTHFPYFQNAPTGWKNSVRHNLSLNKCFKKVDKDKGTSIGKGSLWCIDPEYRPNLLQALRKTPYHPYHQLQMMSSLQPQQQLHHMQGLPSGLRAMPLAQRPVPNTVSPHLFPFLSRRLAHTGRDYIDRDMQDVANTLIAMKGSNSKNSSGMSSDGSDTSDPTSPRSMMKRKYNGPPKRQGPIIVTAYPNEDHNYSSAKVRDEDAASGTSSIDNEYDFGDEDDISDPSDYPSDWDCSSDGNGDEVDGELPLAMQRKRLRIDLKVKEEDKDEEEEKQEGAKLLMSLAGLASYSDEEDGHSRRKPSSLSANKTPLSSSKSSRSVSSSKGRSSSKTSTAASKSLSYSSPQSVKSLSRTSSVSKQSSKTSISSSKATAAASVTSKSTVSMASSSSLSKPRDAASSPLAKQVSSPLSAKSSPSSAASSSKSSIIMTRRGKAAAEAAAAAAAHGMCTRGRKLNSL